MSGRNRGLLESLVVIAALWTPAMIGASHEWSHGSYYGYGWVVPPVALWLASRRWTEDPGSSKPLRRGILPLAVCLLVPWFTLSRVLGLVDPSWRLPVGLLAITAALCSHGYLWATRGRVCSRDFVWITLFLFSAMPMPTVIESNLVASLTRGVIAATVEVFRLFGRPVEAAGGLLTLNGGAVEVSDGCSGIRSFQSFLMATWLFAELQDLRAPRTLLLLLFAVSAAFLVNIARAAALAEISFTQGRHAFEHAHDTLGLFAFLTSALLFYGVSAALATRPARRMITTRQSVQGSKPPAE